ncbi:hypothetical protein JCGZ_03355 [Jatropha curcas]|uniref:Uncharacterized protein n=1 Tax=Jatropha curcas TaxID=180498 RepID=A0A067JQ95_JATCU|nr:hypothetical protein JCGZ_03355 [Jatropha curcas]
MGNQQTITKVMEGGTRNRSISTNSSRNPLSDCTNTIDALNSSQSSSTPTQNSSSSIKPGKLLTPKTNNISASTKSSESQANNENSPSNPSAVFVPSITTSPRTAKASSLEGTATHNNSELSSVYNRRQSENTRRSKRKAVAEPMSCFPAAKTRVTSSDCRLQLAYMKPESLPVSHTAVNLFPGLVHTARHIKLRE